MKLTAVQIRYLLVIHKLSKNGIVRSSEIAGQLNVTKPSVHRMADQLSKMNLIEKERYSYINFTEVGRYMADKYYDGFSKIKDFLMEHLELSSGTAEEGALAILSGLDISIPEEPYIKIHEKSHKSGNSQ